MKLTKIKNNNSLKPTTQKQNEPKKKKHLNLKVCDTCRFEDIAQGIFYQAKRKTKFSSQPN